MFQSKVDCHSSNMSTSMAGPASSPRAPKTFGQVTRQGVHHLVLSIAPIAAQEQDSLAIRLPGQTGALALHTLRHPGLQVAAVRLEEKAAEGAWRLVWDTLGETTRVLLVKSGAGDGAVPAVIVGCQGVGGFSLEPSVVQKTDLAVANPSALLEPLQ